MTDLPERERFILEAVSGWLMLNRPEDARAELEQITPALASHPEVLLRAWDISAHQRHWDEAIDLGDQVIRAAPDSPDGYIKKAYALHELKRTPEAYSCLEPVSREFKNLWIIPYNLACYTCQMGRQTEALDWISRALSLGGKELRPLALADPDLAPLHPALQKLQP